MTVPCPLLVVLVLAPVWTICAPARLAAGMVIMPVTGTVTVTKENTKERGRKKRKKKTKQKHAHRKEGTPLVPLLGFTHSSFHNMQEDSE